MSSRSNPILESDPKSATASSATPTQSHHWDTKAENHPEGTAMNAPQSTGAV